MNKKLKERLRQKKTWVVIVTALITIAGALGYHVSEEVKAIINAILDILVSLGELN